MQDWQINKMMEGMQAAVRAHEAMATVYKLPQMKLRSDLGIGNRGFVEPLAGVGERFAYPPQPIPFIQATTPVPIGCPGSLPGMGTIYVPLP